MDKTSLFTLSASMSSVQLSRNELEDKFFRLKEEHTHLKREAHDSDHQLKFLNAKINRLINEKKRLLNRDKTRREVDLEEYVYDLQQKAAELERENVRLKEKALILKMQLESGAIKKSTYAHVHSKTDSGLGTHHNRSLVRHSSALALNRASSAFFATRPATGIPSTFSNKLKKPIAMGTFSFDLLQEAQDEIKRLESVVAVQQSHLEKMQRETEEMKGLCAPNANSRNLLSARAETKKDTSVTHHSDFGRTDKETEEVAQKVRNGDLVSVVANLQEELKAEKRNCSQLQKKIVEAKMSTKKLEEMNHQLNLLEKENEILRQSLEQCIGSCLSEINGKRKELAVNSQHQYVEKLENEISQLRNELRAEKQKFFDLKIEYERLQEAHKELTQNISQMKSWSGKSLNFLRAEEEVKDSKWNFEGVDHGELRAQLEEMQKERQEFLQEFQEIRDMLQQVKINILSEKTDELE